MMKFTIELKDSVIPEVVDFDYTVCGSLSEQSSRFMTLAFATMCCDKVLDTVLALSRND